MLSFGTVKLVLLALTFIVFLIVVSDMLKFTKLLEKSKSTPEGVLISATGIMIYLVTSSIENMSNVVEVFGFIIGFSLMVLGQIYDNKRRKEQSYNK